MAEYFRDQGQDVLLFVDNIFRFTQVQNCLANGRLQIRWFPGQAKQTMMMEECA